MTANPWAEARDLRSLGELTAQWLEGTIATYPANALDPETEPLRAVLARLNRAGFVTDFSQPRERDTGDGSMQRAAASAFCSDDVLERLEQAIGPTDLVVLAEAHGGHSSTSIPITFDEGEPHTSLVGSYDDGLLVTCFGTPPHTVHPSGLDAIRYSCYVMAFDPVWGRNDRLWPTLADALNAH